MSVEDVLITDLVVLVGFEAIFIATLSEDTAIFVQMMVCCLPHVPAHWTQIIRIHTCIKLTLLVIKFDAE